MAEGLSRGQETGTEAAEGRLSGWGLLPSGGVLVDLCPRGVTARLQVADTARCGQWAHLSILSVPHAMQWRQPRRAPPDAGCCWLPLHCSGRLLMFI